MADSGEVAVAAPVAEAAVGPVFPLCNSLWYKAPEIVADWIKHQSIVIKMSFMDCVFQNANMTVTDVLKKWLHSQSVDVRTSAAANLFMAMIRNAEQLYGDAHHDVIETIAIAWTLMPAETYKQIIKEVTDEAIAPAAPAP